MREILIRILISAIGIAITAEILPGIHILNNDIGTLLIIAVVFGIINGLLKPLLVFLTCPVVLLTLGLFILIINGVMLMVTASLVPDRLQIESFGWAVLGGIIMSIIGLVLENALGVRKK